MALTVALWGSASLLYRGHCRYRNDSRYDLANVSRGFACHSRDNRSDEVLLERICSAYSEALKRERAAAAVYGPTPWWEQQRKWCLRPVIQALERHEIGALRCMYGNFFRDPCSAGLISVQSLAIDHLGETIENLDQRLFLIDFLYRLDYWKERLGSSFAPKDLAGPLIGNPYGVVLDGTLIRMGAEYHHYCAHRVYRLLPAGDGAVAEIGGGYGSMAYYLLRDRPRTKYLNFDVPETCALAAYYLLKAFPGLRIVLCGEAESTSSAIAQADIALLPVCELATMPADCADIVFSSHAISDLSAPAMAAYLNDIDRISRGRLLYIGTGAGGKLICELAQRSQSLRLAQTMRSEWHLHTASQADMVECLFTGAPASSRSVTGAVEEMACGA
jgi:hypothetical protein